VIGDELREILDGRQFEVLILGIHSFAREHIIKERT
jgi:hypothetical protein